MALFGMQGAGSRSLVNQQMKSNLFKVILWRFLSIIVTVLMVYAFTGNIQKTAAMTFVFHLVMTILHYLYEVFWSWYISR